MRAICNNCTQGDRCPYRHRDKCPDVQAYDEGYEQATKDAVEYIKSHIDEGLIIYHNETWTSLDKFCKNLEEHLYANL